MLIERGHFFTRLINTKMADGEGTSVSSSHEFMKNEGKDVSMCKMCTEYETQLKEALDELSSIQMVNKLLQKKMTSSFKRADCSNDLTWLRQDL